MHHDELNLDLGSRPWLASLGPAPNEPGPTAPQPDLPNPATSPNEPGQPQPGVSPSPNAPVTPAPDEIPAPRPQPIHPDLPEQPIHAPRSEHFA